MIRRLMEQCKADGNYSTTVPRVVEAVVFFELNIVIFYSLNQEKEAMNRSQTMEDLHNQLQLNIEANRELNQRVSFEQNIYISLAYMRELIQFKFFFR